MPTKKTVGTQKARETNTRAPSSFEAKNIKEIEDLSIKQSSKDSAALELRELLITGQWTKAGADESVTETEDYAKDVVAQNAVLQHVAPIERYLADAIDGITALRRTFGIGPQTPEDALLKQLQAYIDKYMKGEAVTVFPERSGDQARYFPYNLDGNGRKFVTPSLRDDSDDSDVIRKLATMSRTSITKGTGADAKTIVDSSPVHTAMFAATQYLVDDTLVVQRLRHGVVRAKRDRLLLLERLRKELATTRYKIKEARRELAVRNRTRLESLGDYHLAQQLVREDWAVTETRFVERKQVLDAHQGLYYARVREAPVSLTLPDPLPLLLSEAGDLLPGCGVQDQDLPEELTPFVDAVLDIPMGDWAGLRDQYHLLPGRKRLDALLAQRKVRLDWRLTRSSLGSGGGRANRLYYLHQQNASLLQDLARRALPRLTSLRLYQLHCRDLLSLEDLLTGPGHRLRGPAAELRDQLNQASHCLLQRLRALPPGIRLSWAEGAEEDRSFVVEQAERWPGLEQLEERDFTAVRTLVEVVNWWFRQLHPQASGQSRSAMRNLVRACLLLAASDDPEDIMHGQLKTVPGRFRIGEAMRLTLNREAVPGTQLRLLDANDKLIGTLRVDDEDDQGTVASVTQVFDSKAELSTGFRVTGHRLGTTGVE